MELKVKVIKKKAEIMMITINRIVKEVVTMINLPIRTKPINNNQIKKKKLVKEK